MSLESWKSFFETGGVILLFLTFVFGAGALITANRLNAIKDKELAELKLKTAEANDRAAQNEQEAARLAKEAENERTARVQLESKVAWRRIDGKAQLEMASHLTVFAGEPALIAYSQNDIEAATFASDIAATLHGAHWDVPEPLVVLSMREGPVASALIQASLRGSRFGEQRMKVAEKLLTRYYSNCLHTDLTPHFPQRQRACLAFIQHQRALCCPWSTSRRDRRGSTSLELRRSPAIEFANYEVGPR